MKRKLGSILALAALAAVAMTPVSVSAAEEAAAESAVAAVQTDAVQEGETQAAVTSWKSLADALKLDGTIVLSCDVTAAEDDEILTVPAALR